MKKSIAVMFVALLVLSQVNANNTGEKGEKNIATHVVNGQVIDKLTGEELVGVEITIENTGEKIYSDFDGTFTLPNITPGKYTLKAKLVSYRTGKIEELDINQQKNIMLELVRQ